MIKYLLFFILIKSSFATYIPQTYVTDPITGIQQSVNASKESLVHSTRAWVLLNSTDSVNVGNFPAIQPISGSITANIGTTNGLALDASITSLSAKFGSIGQKTMANSAPIVIASDQSSIPVTGTFFQATQPISGSIAQSGTWTFQQGATPTAIANAWPVKPTDGTTAITVKAASTAAIATDTSQVVALSPNTALPAGTNIIGAVAPIDGFRQTYRSASAAAFSSAATATDICTITGSGTKTIRVTRAWITGIQTTSSEVNFFLLKRSTANTGGTSTALTSVPLDSNNAAATATTLQYTANPSTGNLVGNVGSFKMDVPVVAIGGNGAPAPIFEIKFGETIGQALVLRGTTQVFAINLGSITIAGGSFLCTFEWTEE